MKCGSESSWQNERQGARRSRRAASEAVFLLNLQGLRLQRNERMGLTWLATPAQPRALCLPASRWLWSHRSRRRVIERQVNLQPPAGLIRSRKGCLGEPPIGTIRHRELGQPAVVGVLDLELRGDDARVSGAAYSNARQRLRARHSQLVDPAVIDVRGGTARLDATR